MTGAMTALLAGLFGVCFGARSPVLTPDGARSFQGLMHMAQTGAFGRDVVNANIGIDGGSVHLELVRDAPPNQNFVLTLKRATGGGSRYFDVAGGAGTVAADGARVARTIDDAFDASPFECLSASAMQPDSVSRTSTIAVIVGMGVALAGSLFLLWGNAPPASSGRFGA